MRTSSRPAAASSAVSVSASGKRAPLELRHRREPAREPHVVECAGSSVAIASRPAGARIRATSASARGRSSRCSDMRITAASNQPRLNGSASARATRALTPSALRAGDHLRRRVDGPDARVRPLLERLRQPARAAADLEHARAAQLAELDEPLEELPTSSRRRGAARRSAPRSGRSRRQPALPSSPSGATSASSPGAAPVRRRRGAPARRRP